MEKSEERNPHPLFFSNNKVPLNQSLNQVLPFGCLLSPFSPFLTNDSVVRKPPVACKGCGAIVNRYCSLGENGAWKCCFCKVINLNPEAFGVSKEEALNSPEFHRPILDYIDPHGQILGSNELYLQSCVIFLIDLTLPTASLEIILRGIVQITSQFSPETTICVIGFTNVLVFVDLSSSEATECTILNGVSIPSKEHFQPLQSRIQDFFVSLHRVSENLEKTLFSLSKSSIHLSSQSGKKFRSFGSAIEALLFLLPNFSSSFVFSFLSAFPNCGPGDLAPFDSEDFSTKNEKAFEFYSELGKKCSQRKMRVDLYCLGFQQFFTRTLFPLCQNTGGHLVLLKEISCTFSQNISLSLKKRSGTIGSLTFHCSPGISISQVIGPVKLKQQQQQQQSDQIILFDLLALDSDSSISIQLDLDFNSLNSSNNSSSNSLNSLNNSSNNSSNSFYFQAIIKFFDLNCQWVTRILTRSLDGETKMDSLIESMDVDATSILISRELVLEGNQKSIREALNSLDLKVKNLLTFTTQRTNSQFNVPKNISSLCRKMFYLRRGSLLGPILQHPDDIFYFQQLFLRADFETCLSLIEPKLFMVKEDTETKLSFYLIPAEDLALQSNKVLLMDHFTDIFVWSGLEILSNSFDHQRQFCQDYILQLSHDRFPQPQIQFFKEGSSMARFLQCRLIPSHKDPPDLQKENFPQLYELSSEEIKKLVSKFHKTADLSFSEYLRKALIEK